MRVLYLCADLGVPVLGTKGAAVHVRSLVGALTRAGHEVVLATPALTRSPWDVPAAVHGRLLHLPPGEATTSAVLAFKAHSEAVGLTGPLPGELRRVLYDEELAVVLKRRFEHHPPDFVYERLSVHATAGVRVARQLAVPLLLEVNTPVTAEQAAYRGSGLPELAAAAERLTLSRADAVLVVSSALVDHVVAAGADPGRVHVLPNAVDPALFHPRPPEASPAAAGDGLGPGPVVGFVGGLRPWHGVECLPELLERLRAEHPDVRLLVVGDGPQRSRLEAELAARGLSGAARFTGALPHEEVPALIRRLDVALAPYEPPAGHFYFSPLKVFEYLACGAPVVAARIGQIAEVVEDGATGLLYPPGDLDALVAACRRLLADPELRVRLGAAGAAAVAARHTWDHNAARVVELARSLLGGPEAGG